ncbi:MAG: SCO family protein [Alphaproteobacteria bacterium]
MRYIKAMDIKKRLIRTLFLCLLGLAIGGGIAFMQIMAEESERAQSPAPSMAGIDLGGDFTLTDHTGQTVSQADYEGQYKLIYFGFTYCPAICPTELQKITRVMNALEPDIAAQIQPLFISVDPERDTPTVMADYVDMFHPRLIGLTGTLEQIDDVKKKYKIFATKVQDDTMTEYTVDHSSFIYFMGPDNKALGIYRMKDDAAYIQNDIQRILATG